MLALTMNWPRPPQGAPVGTGGRGKVSAEPADEGHGEVRVAEMSLPACRPVATVAEHAAA